MYFKAPSFSAEFLRSILDYNPSTGEFRWRPTKITRGVNKNRFGKLAGGPADGYIAISYKRQRFLAHRLAWFHFYGEWPAGDIDHINMKRDDNRIANLRPASRSENMSNTVAHRDNKAGFKGVFLDKRRGVYGAQICCQGKKHTVGYFKTAEEAHNAYREAAARLRGEFARAA